MLRFQRGVLGSEGILGPVGIGYRIVAFEFKMLLIGGPENCLYLQAGSVSLVCIRMVFSLVFVLGLNVSVLIPEEARNRQRQKNGYFLCSI
jgi:hypothetical protein